eukprot:364586-Chlamydomonas_euryale.AAC.2
MPHVCIHSCTRARLLTPSPTPVTGARTCTPAGEPLQLQERRVGAGMRVLRSADWEAGVCCRQPVARRAAGAAGVARTAAAAASRRLPSPPPACPTSRHLPSSASVPLAPPRLPALPVCGGSKCPKWGLHLQLQHLRTLN